MPYVQRVDGTIVGMQRHAGPGFAEEVAEDDPELLAFHHRDEPSPADEVRAEAHRRIVAFMPDWRQRNALARSQELQEAREVRRLTPAEEAEAAAITAAWGWIKGVREASNRMEPDPPPDFADDRHWPPRPSIPSPT